MNAQVFLERLSECGVTLYLSDGTLKYRAPTGVVNPNVLARIRQYKVPLIACLSEQAILKSEQRIAEEIADYTAVRDALLTIRDKRLYRNSAATFEEYCASRWGIPPDRLNDLLLTNDSLIPADNFLNDPGCDLASYDTALRLAMIEQLPPCHPALRLPSDRTASDLNSALLGSVQQWEHFTRKVRDAATLGETLAATKWQLKADEYARDIAVIVAWATENA